MYWRAKKGVDERVRHYFAARLRKRSVFRKRLARKKEPVRRFSARWSNVMHEKLGRRERNSPRHEKSLSLSPFCDRPYSTVSRFHRSGEALNPTRARFNWSTNKASPSADPPDQYRTYEVVSSFDIAAQLLFLAGKTLINTRSPSISNEGETRYREETRNDWNFVFIDATNRSPIVMGRNFGFEESSPNQNTVCFASTYE